MVIGYHTCFEITILTKLSPNRKQLKWQSQLAPDNLGTRVYSSVL